MGRMVQPVTETEQRGVDLGRNCQRKLQQVTSFPR
jgi:exonuclease VII small subunit